MKPLQLNLDIKNNSYEEMVLMQGYTYPLEATLTDGGQPFSLTGHTITLELLKADNTFIIQSETITIKDNVVSVAMLKDDFTRVSGTGKLQIVARKGGLITGSWVVSVRIKEAAINKAVGESKDTVTIKETLDNSIQQAIEENAKTEHLIATGGAATKGDIAEINSHLDSIAQDITLDCVNRKTTQNLEKLNNVRGIVSFVDDDGHFAVHTKLKPLSIKHNIPFSCALYVDEVLRNGQSYINGFLELQNNYGFEICSHSYTHTPINDSLTKQQTYKEVVLSALKLRELGFDVKNLVFPYGQMSKYGAELMSQTYNCGVSTDERLNPCPINNYQIGRIEFPHQNVANRTFEYYKTHIDDAFTNKKWLMFMTHCGMAQHNEEMQQLLDDLIVYIKSKDMDITTVQGGLNIFGNVISYDKNRYFLAPNGSNNIINYESLISNQSTGEDAYTASNLPNYFKLNKTVLTLVNSGRNDVNLPAKRIGVIQTVMTGAYEYSYQLFITEINIYKRIPTSSTTWGVWYVFVGIDINKIGSVNVTATINPKESYIQTVNTAWYDFSLSPSCTPRASLPNGLMFSCHHTGNEGQLKIVIFNTTSNAITLTNFPFKYWFSPVW